MKKNKGISSLIIILCVAIITLAILILLPYYNNYRKEAQRIACNTQLRTAKSAISISVLEGNNIDNGEENFVIMDETIPGWDGNCPAGGDVYALIDDSALNYKLVCALHGSNAKQCTRLNAYNAFNQIQNNLQEKEIEVTLNSKTYTAKQVSEKVSYSELSPQAKKDGTNIIYYGLYGDGFKETKSHKKGELAYFAYADETYNVIWTEKESWMGTARN